MTNRNQPSSAFILGVQAFDNGIACAPRLDRKLMDLISMRLHLGVVGITSDSPGSVKMLTDWTQGWTMANLSQDVPGWTAEENSACHMACNRGPGSVMNRLLEAARAAQ